MPGFAKRSASKLTYSDLMELSIYSDLKAVLRPNSKIKVASDEELSKVEEILENLNIPFLMKSKREVFITAF